MKKIVESIKKRPINMILIIFVISAYLLNNLYLKKYSGGFLKMFLVCYFNDFICPLFFFSYANLLLITVDKEIKHLWVTCLISMGTSFVWEFIAPIIKPTSITDPFDIVCYISGGIVYWTLLCYVRKKKQGIQE